jgi:hypothetical protein
MYSRNTEKDEFSEQHQDVADINFLIAVAENMYNRNTEKDEFSEQHQDVAASVPTSTRT